MASTMIRKVLLQVTADDADAEEKIDRISAKADELSEKHPDLKVRIDTAAASAKLAVLKEELKAVSRDAKVDVEEKTSGGKVGLIEQLLYGAGGRAALDAETAGEGGGGSGGLLGILSGNFGNIGALAAGAALIAPAIAAVLVELTGLVSGFAAATLGVGALALVAIPTFEKVKAALADTPAELKKQPKLIQDIVGQVDQLKKSFDKIGQSMMPQLLQIFDTGLGIAAQLMPVVAQFAQAAAPAVETVMKALSAKLDSQGFKDFVDKLSKISGPAIVAIGQGFIKVAGAVGHLLTVMSAHDVVHALNIAFDALAGTINLFATWVGGAMRNWDRFSGAIREGWQNILKWNYSAASTLTSIFHTIGRLFTTDPEQWVSDAVSWFKKLPGMVMGAIDGLSNQLFEFGAHIISMLAKGIESAAGSVVGAISRVAGDILDHIPHSPAKRGPLSGSGSPDVAGRKIAQMLAQGMTAGVPYVSAASGRVAAAAGVTASGARLGGAGAYGPGGQQRLILEIQGGSTEFRTFLKKTIRATGGNPAVVGF